MKGDFLMIIKALSSESNEIARKARNFIQEISKERVYLVPHGLDGLFITIDSKSKELTVIADNGTADDLDIVQGFNELEECWDYARIVAKEAGLSENNIDADIFEDNTLYVIVSIIQDHKGSYKVYGQGFATNEEMEVRLFGSFETLEQAKEKAEFVAVSHDCPLVEMVHDSRPKMRDLVEELG
jgi:hypothetical protein